MNVRSRQATGQELHDPQLYEEPSGPGSGLLSVFESGPGWADGRWNASSRHVGSQPNGRRVVRAIVCCGPDRVRCDLSETIGSTPPIFDPSCGTTHFTALEASKSCRSRYTRKMVQVSAQRIWAPLGDPELALTREPCLHNRSCCCNRIEIAASTPPVAAAQCSKRRRTEPSTYPRTTTKRTRP
jgi:hypothetical protein